MTTKTKAIKSVDEYIASQPASAKAALRRVRDTLRKALPEAEEVISYSMPAYRSHGRIVLYFAAWKEHYSLYPAGQRLDTALLRELARYEVSKGTIRFPLSEPVPVRFISRIAKFRAREIAKGAKASRGIAGRRKAKA